LSDKVHSGSIGHYDHKGNNLDITPSTILWGSDSTLAVVAAAASVQEILVKVEVAVVMNPP